MIGKWKLSDDKLRLVPDRGEYYWLKMAIAMLIAFLIGYFWL